MKAKSHSYRKYKLQARKTEYLLLWPPRASAETQSLFLFTFEAEVFPFIQCSTSCITSAHTTSFWQSIFYIPLSILGRKQKNTKANIQRVERLLHQLALSDSMPPVISRKKNKQHFTPTFQDSLFLRYPAPETGIIPIFPMQIPKNKSSCSLEEYLQSVKTQDVLHPGILWKDLDSLLVLKKRAYCYTIYSTVLGNLRAV